MSKKKTGEHNSEWERKQAEYKAYVQDQFQKAKEVFPDLEESTLVDAGSFGIVVSPKDDRTSLYKIAYRPKIPTDTFAKQNFVSEVRLYKHVRDNPIEGVTTPILIGDPEEVDDDNFIGRYKMTRIPGQKFSLYETDENYDENLVTVTQNAARVLARFHMNVDPAVFPEVSDSRQVTGVKPVKSFTTEQNEALERVSKFLSSKLIPGVMHGDYHQGNIMCDEEMNVTGIIDWGMSGKTKNVLIDFMGVPTNLLATFTRAYEDESGIRIDDEVLKAMNVSMLASQLSRLEEMETNTEERQAWLKDELESHLKELAPISNYQP